MSELSCQIDLQGRAPDKGLTVGDPFLLICDGEINREMNGGMVSQPLQSNTQFIFEVDESKYTLHVLAVKESSPQNVKLLVTSYKPGEYKNQSLKLSDGVTTVITQGVSWKVNSILNPQEKEPKPFPSEGPFLIHYPLWFWVTLAVVTIFLVGAIWTIFYRRKKQKQLLAELESHMTMLTPFAQFSRDMRLAARLIEASKPDTTSRSGELVKKLSDDFRLYLVRELKVPAHKFSDGQILRAIKKNHRHLYDVNRSDIRRVLSEFTKASQDNQKIKSKDCEDLFYLSRTVAEKIYNTKRKAK